MRKKYLLIATICALLCIVLYFTACEWESADDDTAWNDNYAWANFSGTYRGAPGRMIVDNFRTTTPSSTNGAVSQKFSVVDEPDGNAPAMQTKLSGSCNRIPVLPGSLTVRLWSDVYTNWIGTFTDNGGGVLNGTYNIVGPDQPKSGTGTIEYDTGVWALELQSPGLLQPATIYLSYVYEIKPESPVQDVTGNEESIVAGGNVYNFVVQQYGEKLLIRASNGAVFEGKMGPVKTTTGDSSGAMSGRIVANFQATGTSGREKVTLVGTFEGDYTYTPASGTDTPTPTAASGTLKNRLIQGTWIEADGDTADILGYADQQ